MVVNLKEKSYFCKLEGTRGRVHKKKNNLYKIWQMLNTANRNS